MPVLPPLGDPTLATGPRARWPFRAVRAGRAGAAREARAHVGSQRCHAHHIRHWADDGETCLENLTLLCSYHHHVIHHDQWTITMVDGRPWYVPPRWLDPARRPRPGGRFPLAAPQPVA